MSPDQQRHNHEDIEQPIFDVKQWNVNDLAGQITLGDLEVFKRINVEELTSFGWASKRKAQEAPNVNEFTRRFNCLSFLTCKSVLSSERPEKRAQVIGYFIKLAKKLFNLNNLHAAYAIISALGMQPVFRLAASWERVPKTDRASLDKLNEFFSSKDNFHTLRNHMSLGINPCVPHIGIYLTDLTFYNDRLKRANGDEENVQESINKMLRMLFSFQDSSYDISSSAQLEAALDDFYNNASQLGRDQQNDLFALSVRLEPESLTDEQRRSSLPSQKSLQRAVSKASVVQFLSSRGKKYSVSPSVNSPTSTLQRAFKRGHKKADSLDEAKILGVSNHSISDFDSPRSTAGSTSLHRSPSSPTHSAAVSPSIWYDSNSSRCTYNQLNNEEDDNEQTDGPRNRVDRSGSSVSLVNEIMKKLRLKHNETPVGSARLPRKIRIQNEKNGRRAAKSADNTPIISRRLFVMNNSMDERLYAFKKSKGHGFGKSDESALPEKFDGLDDSPLLFETTEPEISGVFSKTQLRSKNHKIKLVRTHHSCYLELRNGILLEFERKLVPLYIEDERAVFQSKPKKFFDLKSGDWTVETPAESATTPRRAGFELHDKLKGRVYHYACRNWTMANHWKKILDENINDSADEKRSLKKIMSQKSKESYTYEDTDIDGLDLEEQRLDEVDEEECEVTRL
ncbi:unnamed protein product [Bursaphelenchus xylophilus]|uniref:(pine wood nematode) hypothetical protein n=1 Tax=Bursaphelenchus xylophilus TaxID=6326 RepID=A0A1I7S0J8_BURXY|nr:unnamed protein product [Bursaphelenchus xylophilus]CAG9132294.1 unnamed protein product [Bursaphelenchus xylophilus]